MPRSAVSDLGRHYLPMPLLWNARQKLVKVMAIGCIFFGSAITEGVSLPITKTCLYHFDSLKPHFYIVELGFSGVYINFLIFAQKHRLWVLRGGSSEYP